MTRRGLRRTAREVFLTSGAVLGVLCIVATVAGIAFGVMPLVFRSGSMSPAINTGDLAISRTVPASEVERGDIVSVITSTGVRVTHRVVNIAENGESRQLTLKGDDNQDPDAEVYTVSEVERVWFDIPKAGYVVDTATGPVGIFVLGLYVAGMLVMVFRRRPPERGDDEPPAPRAGARRAEGRAVRSRGARTGSRRAARVAVVVSAVTLLAGSPALATPWTNAVAVGSGATLTTLTSLTVPPPTAGTCTNGLNATIGWTTAGAAYSYRVTVTNASTGAVVGTPATTTSTSMVMSTALLGNLGSINLVATVQAFPTGVPTWVSTSSVVQNFRSRTAGLGTACGHL